MASDELPSEIDIAQGQIDEPLNEKGKVQAKFLGKQVAAQRFKIKNIYCAKQIRCQETARIIARQLKSPVNIIVDQRLNARSYGIIADVVQYFVRRVQSPDGMIVLGGVKMAKCCICGKGVVFGQNVSHSHRKTNRTWKPNIRKVKLEGSKAINVCSRCLRTMKKA